MWEAPASVAVLDLKRHRKIHILKLSACKLPAKRKPFFTDVNKDSKDLLSEDISMQGVLWQLVHGEAVAKPLPQCASEPFGDSQQLFLPGKYCTCDCNGRVFKGPKQRSVAIEAATSLSKRISLAFLGERSFLHTSEEGR